MSGQIIYKLKQYPLVNKNSLIKLLTDCGKPLNQMDFFISFIHNLIDEAGNYGTFVSLSGEARHLAEFDFSTEPLSQQIYSAYAHLEHHHGKLQLIQPNNDSIKAVRAFLSRAANQCTPEEKLIKKCVNVYAIVSKIQTCLLALLEQTDFERSLNQLDKYIDKLRLCCIEIKHPELYVPVLGEHTSTEIMRMVNLQLEHETAIYADALIERLQSMETVITQLKRVQNRLQQPHRILWHHMHKLFMETTSSLIQDIQEIDGFIHTLIHVEAMVLKSPIHSNETVQELIQKLDDAMHQVKSNLKTPSNGLLKQLKSTLVSSTSLAKDKMNALKNYPYDIPAIK